MKTKTSPGNSYMLRIVQEFLAQGGTEPIDLDELATYAIATQRFDQKAKMRQLCKRAFSKAFREQYHTDPQGRSVRTRHAVTEMLPDGTQKVLWGDMRHEPEEFVQTAVQQRRRHIVGECRGLKRDVDSFNDNNAFGATIQLDLDFGQDIAEADQPTKYRPKKAK
jgi:hypothetical protein